LTRPKTDSELLNREVSCRDFQRLLEVKGGVHVTTFFVEPKQTRGLQRARATRAFVLAGLDGGGDDLPAVSVGSSSRTRCLRRSLPETGLPLENARGGLMNILEYAHAPDRNL
jgi:hypothetical protein